MSTWQNCNLALVGASMMEEADKDGRTLDRINSRHMTGYRTTGPSVYFLIPSSGSGAVGTNYGVEAGEM